MFVHWSVAHHICVETSTSYQNFYQNKKQLPLNISFQSQDEIIDVVIKLVYLV